MNRPLDRYDVPVYSERVMQERIGQAVAAERERIRQLALAEAAKGRASNFSVAGPIGAGALEDFADLLREDEAHLGRIT